MAAGTGVSTPGPEVTGGTGGGGSAVNVAVALRAAVIESVQVGAVPAQAPLQPVKLEPVAAAAVSVTFAP